MKVKQQGYQWTFQNIGGTTRVKIQSGEDIRHLGELDQKMWTVLSCPTSGLEIPDEMLQLLDLDGDSKIRVNEVIKTADWLCAVLNNPDILLEENDLLSLENLNADNAEAAQMLEVAKRLAGDNNTISLGEVLAAVEAVTINEQVPELKEVPAAPYDAEIMAAYAEDKEAFDAYFKDLRLEKLGLKKTDPETAPAIKEAKWNEMAEAIAAYESQKATIEADNAAATQAAADANTAALAAATAEYRPLIKLLRLKKNFFTLLKNYITFEDFYGKETKAIFQCGTLIIDQRSCDLCVRVQDAGAMGTFAGLSGMYLLFLDCVNKTQNKQMSIVACVSAGDIDDLFVGKNAIFYDRSGLDYDAKVTKIIDNPISIKQAFWSPYKKFAKWVKELVNKSAAEKESKGFEDMKANATEATATAAEGGEQKKQAFDIAKFAGIFAAIGMALGFIGGFLTSLGGGIKDVLMMNFGWLIFIGIIIAIMLCISGPSMFIAYLKLRARNMAPVLNSNGWAINARAMVNVPFGKTLTQEANFPMLKQPMKAWKKWCIGISCTLVVLCGLWLGNLCAWAGLKSPLPCFNKEAQTEVLTDAEPQQAENTTEVVAGETAEAPAEAE